MNITSEFQVIYPTSEVAPYTIQTDNMDKEPVDYSAQLNKSLKRFFLDALWVSLRNPAQAYSFFRTVRHQMKAAKVRAQQEKAGVHVPPIVIYSITNRCNLHCKGCYHQALRAFARPELSDGDMKRVIGEARDLGVSFMVLAGGEPLVRKEIIDVAGQYSEIVFFIFTNGLMIDEAMIAKLKNQRNVVPVISLEGYEQQTDARRGQGVYEHLKETAANLKKAGIFFGTSVTMTRANFATITDEKFVKAMMREGSKMFFYAEYTPIREGTEDWVVTDLQRDEVANLMNQLRNKNRALFIAVPGDEEQFGGCLAAGKGFIHISAEGNIEACPFAPYSDCNVMDVSLEQGLQSKLLKAIRENGESLKEGAGGCALWDKREWVQSLVSKQPVCCASPVEEEEKIAAAV